MCGGGVVSQPVKATADTFTQRVRRKHISPPPVESYRRFFASNREFRSAV